MKPIVAAPESLVYVRIANELREQILVGAIAAGDRLPRENELSRQFGASRTSVREALRVLTAQGLIATHRGSSGGSVVLELDHRDVMKMLELNMRSMVSSEGSSELEMSEVRELLEVTAAWLAASRRTPDHLTRLAECIPDIAPDSTPTQDQVDLNLRFHYVILEATGNRLLHLFAEPVSVLIHSFFRTQEHEPAYYQMAVEDHRRIARAIASRDAEAARLAMSEHIAKQRRYGGEPGIASAFDGLRFSV